MSRIKTQADKVRARLLQQAELVLRKFKPTKVREVSNQEIEIALYQYSTAEGSVNEYGEKHLEWLHDKMTVLNEEEMAVIKKRYWEAKSFAVIGNELGHLHDPKWAYRKINEVLSKLRLDGKTL